MSASRGSGTALRETTIEEAMAAAGQWACLIGPQAAGKSIYAQYLGGFLREEPHAWTLRPYLQRLTGGLRVAAVDPPEYIPLLPPVPAVNRTARFYRVEGTRDILHFAARGSRERRRMAGELEVHFFDVPGEWAQRRFGARRPESPAPPSGQGQGGAGEKSESPDALETLLGGTHLFVLFVPFWALLPVRWLANTGCDLGEVLWATSLAQEGARGGIDAARVREAADAAHADVEAWVRALEHCAPERFDLLVVLSQFQEQSVRGLLDAYLPGLGERTWQAYQECLAVPAGQVQGDVRELAGRLDELREIGFELLGAIDATRSGADPLRGGEAPALDMLHRLLPLYDLVEANALRAARRRARTVAIYPLNTVRLDRANQDLFARGAEADVLGDFRMCEDVLWWILLQLAGHRIWMP